MNKAVRQILSQTSILGGMSETYDFSTEGQYLAALGIDPELILANKVKPSNTIAPTKYSEFSGIELDSAPMWITGAPTTTGVYVFGANGTLIAYNGATMTTGVSIGTPTSDGTTALPGQGDGLIAYNDYIYAALRDDVARYGPLSATAPSWTNSYWVGSLGQSAISSSATYPGIRTVTYPGHVLYTHNDGRTYVSEYDGSNGRLHSFTTDANGTNGSATYNDLTLPPQMMPTAVCRYGEDIAVLCTPQGRYDLGTIPKSQGAALYFWDAIATHRFYREIPIHEPIATGMVNKNGELFVLAGNIDTGVKLLKYIGGDSFQTLVALPEGSPPPAGAVDAVGNMIAWGGYVTYPTDAAGAFTYGHRSSKLPTEALHHIARISQTTDILPIVTCLRFLQRSNNPVIGWRTDTGFGVDKKSGGTYSSIFQTRKFLVNKPGTVKRIRFSLGSIMQSGVVIQPSVYVDNEAANTSLDQINPTNYSSSERFIDLQGLQVNFKNDFYVRFDFTGTQEIAIQLPIEIEVEYED